MSPSLATNISNSSSPCFSAYTKLRFFNRIRRLLKPKTPNKQYPQPSNQFDTKQGIPETEIREITEEMVIRESCVLQSSVKRLHFGSWEEKEVAAMEIRRLAGEDLKVRKSLPELGVVPPLVAMVGSEVVGRRRLAVQALIELANGTYRNKALIVDAGIISELPENTDVLDESTKHEFAQLLFSISSLANSQFPLTSSKFLLFLIGILESDSNLETKELCLGTLYNLSTLLDNAGSLVTNGVVHTLLRLSSLKVTSEKALATLGNLVVTFMGKKAMENNEMLPENLIEILTWEEKSKCQEFSAYILMILAHQSSEQRVKMVKAGIVPVLLEVALLGSPLAQKRALRLLQWFKDERQTRIGPHSGPQRTRMSIGSPVNPREAQEGKKMMKKMVKESLYKNMQTITQRANAAGESSKLKALVISSSSKSLPY